MNIHLLNEQLLNVRLAEVMVMYERLLIESRAMELKAQETEIRHRMEWHQIATIERLEKALSVAKRRLHLGQPTLQAG